MAKRGFWVIFGLCLAAILVIAYLNYSYFFNPLTFKQGAVTHLPWQWYKNPLRLEYAVLDDDGWKMVTVDDRAEIGLVFQELQTGVERTVTSLEPGGRQVWFGVRRQTDGAILLSVSGREQGMTCQVERETKIILTERLQQLLQERLQQARIGATKRQATPMET